MIWTVVGDERIDSHDADPQLDELEAVGIARLAEIRLGKPTPRSSLLTIEELARRFGVAIDTPR